MEKHLKVLLVVMFFCAWPAAAQDEGFRFTYEYWAEGYEPSADLKRPAGEQVTVEVRGNRVRAVSPREIHVINVKSGELLYIERTAKTFGYAQLGAYMDHMRSVNQIAADAVAQFPPALRELAERQRRAKGIDPLRWISTARRGRDAASKCAFVDGRIGSEVQLSVCADAALSGPAAEALAQLEETVAAATGGQRIIGIFGTFPWPLDFPFSQFGVPAVVERSTGSGGPNASLRVHLELRESGPAQVPSSAFSPPADFRQVDLFDR